MPSLFWLCRKSKPNLNPDIEQDNLTSNLSPAVSPVGWGYRFTLRPFVSLSVSPSVRPQKWDPAISQNVLGLFTWNLVDRW